MKYLVSATAADLNAKIHKRFGFTDVFLIVDGDTFAYEAFPGVGHDEQSHGTKRFEQSDIERIIVGNIGPEAFEDVRAAGWEIYLCRAMTVREAVERVHSGQILPLEEPSIKRSVHKKG